MKKLLVETLEEFLLKDQIDEITVNDILAASGVSRTTFYRYFRDKYDLINYIYQKKIDDLNRKYHSKRDSYKITLEILNYVAEKREVFTKIINYTGQNSFTEFFINAWIKEDTELVKEILKVDTLSKQDEYLINYNAIGFTMTMYKWLTEGCKETPKELLSMIDTFSPQKMIHYYRMAHALE